MLVVMGLLLGLSQNAYALLDRYGYQFCHSSDYTCIAVKPGDTWTSLFPDPHKRDVVMRLNRMNIPLRYGMRLAVPRYDRVNYWSISPFPPAISPMPSKAVIVSMQRLAWGAYEPSGRLVAWGPISAGQSWCSDTSRECKTVLGTFTFNHKRGADCISGAFPVGEGGAPMPYCMFFHQGYALHGGPAEVPGFNASHGCVRLFVDDARWLNEHFVDLAGSGKPPTKVVVQN